jgi:hypothetical protein
MNLSREDYEKIYKDIEAVIVGVYADSNVRKIKSKYMLTPSEVTAFEKAYFIAAAEIRQGIERTFDKYIDANLAEEVRTEVEKRKRGPRTKLIADPNPSGTVKETKIGSFAVESFD